MTAAKRLLVAIADGASDAEKLAVDLAELDLVARGGARALEVLGGGPFALVRAVQLAEEVLSVKYRADPERTPSPRERPKKRSSPRS